MFILANKNIFSKKQDIFFQYHFNRYNYYDKYFKSYAINFLITKTYFLYFKFKLISKMRFYNIYII